MQVHDTVQQLVHRDENAPTPVARRVVPIAQEVNTHLTIIVMGVHGNLKHHK